MRYVIQIVGVMMTNEQPVHVTYIKDMDFDAFDGRGDVTLTENLADAKRFNSAPEAFEYWRMQSTAKPLRDDGKPNRPLTAYMVDIHPEADQPWPITERSRQ